MISLFANFLIARNPAMTLSFARRLVKIGLAVLALAGLAVAVWMIRRDAVDDHEAGRVKDALAAEQRANAADDTRRDAAKAQSQDTLDQLETIHAQDPEGATAPASAGSRAVARRLPDS